MNNTELANRFRKVANDFQRLVDEHRLHNTAVYMTVGWDLRHPDIPLCDTQASHGGWAAIMYGVEEDGLGPCFYSRGADLLAQELGFDDLWEMEWWARDNPQHWGDGHGEDMFHSRIAFGKRSDKTLTLLDIIAWYRAVADRLEADT